MIPLTLGLAFIFASALILLIPGPNGRLRNRLSGGLLIGAGIGLTLTGKN